MDSRENAPLKDRLAKWAFFLKNEGNPVLEEYMRALIKDEPVFDKARDVYAHFTSDPLNLNP